MRFILIVFTLIAFQIKLNAQSFNFNQGGFTNTDYFIEIPYTRVKGKIIIEVKMGAEVRKFILDTGAPTAISISLLEKLKLDILSSQDFTDINGRKSVLEVANIKELKLGESVVADIPAVVLDENILTKCFDVDGLIGSNLLRNSIVQFDYKNKVIRISNDINKINISNAKPSDILIDKQSSPIFNIQLGDKAKEMLLFDSGADELYSMSNNNLEKLKKAKAFSVISESLGSNSFGINGLERESKNYRLLIPEFNIMGFTLKNIVSETTSDGNSRIGARLLEYGMLTINYKNSKSYFEPFSQIAINKEEYWDLSPTFMNGKLVVGRIWSQELKKIAVGDQILFINDKDMTSFTECEFLFSSPLADIKKATLKVQDAKGEIQTIEIKKI
ncbi:hypothetical protein A5893_13870 [Pedobacter psychrophilus]|uniref:Aspartyl protease n=2 Tax=Pedobacter psychrophilus TaxID=1826909 RepID=A0A179DC01_9SPHI|nr:hypothetical protein A5893_13870 [Pedobacter psychrophilus]